MNTNDQYRQQQQQDRESSFAPAYRNGFNQERAWQAAREREYAQQQHFQAQASRQQQEDSWDEFSPRGGYLQERNYQSPEFGYGQVGITPQQQYGLQEQGRSTQFAHNQYMDEYAPQQQQRRPQPQYAQAQAYAPQQPRPYPPYQPAYAGSQPEPRMQYGQASMAQQPSAQGYLGQQSYHGQGPKNYARPDDRIRDDVCERLSDSHSLNAKDVDVQAKEGLITLSGTVTNREMKREAEDLAHACSGVRDVQNNLRIQPQAALAQGTTAASPAIGTQSTLSAGTARPTDRH